MGLFLKDFLRTKFMNCAFDWIFGYKKHTALKISQISPNNSLSSYFEVFDVEEFMRWIKVGNKIGKIQVHW